MNFTTFESAFRDSVKTSVNWRHLRANPPVISEVVISNRDDLGDVLVPWYMDGQTWG